jgi:hypothetical protein
MLLAMPEMMLKTMLQAMLEVKNIGSRSRELIKIGSGRDPVAVRVPA